jgi:amidase
MTDPTAFSAVELAAALRAGELKAVEALAAFRRRIARLDPHIHAIARLVPGAQEQAVTADAGKPLGPLHGVPITIKDAFRAAGSSTTFGVPGQQLSVPPGDCELVRRIRSAGAVIHARTALPLACFDW